MVQFARPDGDVTNTGTGGFADVDEASPSDADFWWGANNTAEELEVSLSNATDPNSSSGHIFRYRIAKTNGGVVDGGGNACTVTARLMQGATEIAADTAKTATGTWTQYALTLSAGQADAITDYTDLRLEFLTSASGGSPANRRGAAVSWAELEVPSGSTQFNQALPATTTVTAGLASVIAFTKTLPATTTVTAAVGRVVSFSQALAASTTVAPAFVRAIAKTLAATTTVAPALARQMFVTLTAVTTAAASMTASLVLHVTMTATTAVSAALGTAFTAVRSLAAVSTAGAALATQFTAGAGVVRRWLYDALVLLRK